MFDPIGRSYIEYIAFLDNFSHLLLLLLLLLLGIPLPIQMPLHKIRNPNRHNGITKNTARFRILKETRTDPVPRQPVSRPLRQLQRFDFLRYPSGLFGLAYTVPCGSFPGAQLLRSAWS